MKQSRSEVQKRHQRILEMLYLQNSIQTADASKILQVSELTLRRDLEILESRGYIQRFHGGARLDSSNTKEVPIFECKGSMNQLQKQQIARLIPQFLKNRDVVFLNGGTTTLEIIHCIKHMNITIVTNNAMACFALANGKAEFFSTGGEYNRRNRSYTGELAINLIRRICPTACILGVNGISNANGITTSAYSEAIINQEALRRCHGKKIIAADGSKIGKAFCFTSAAITDIDVLITDSSADLAELEKIRSCGVQILLADQVTFPSSPERQ